MVIIQEYQQKSWLRQKYWGDGLSLRAMGRLVGKPKNTIIYWMKKHDIPRRLRTERLKGQKRSLTTRRRISESKRGEKHPRWGGGRKDINGYVAIHKPCHPHIDRFGYVLEHRLVMERHLGRYLKPEEIVHHKNGKRADNRIENLMLFASESEHQKFHRLRPSPLTTTRNSMMPYVGQRVILNTLLLRGDFPGTILQIGNLTYFGRPLCVVELDCQEDWVHSVIYYDERPKVVGGTLWQICYPLDNHKE